ncbi:MAG: hypothetical protein ACKVP0_20970 [Pirellulaceae bacterium]
MKRFFLTAALVAALASAVGYWWEGRKHEARRQEQADLELRLEQELDKLISLEEIAGSEQNMLDVLRHVARQVDVPVVYYPASLTKEMLLDRRVISLPKTKLSLRSTFEILSRQLPIGYYAEKGQLVINSSNEAGSVLTTRIYPLPQSAGPQRPFAANLDSWIEVVTREIDPDSWEDVGGNAEVHSVPGALVIRQTCQNHDRLRQFFRQLERATLQLDAQADLLSSYSPVERRILAALESSTDFECANAPLLEVMDDFFRKHRIPFVLCHSKLEESAVDLEMPLTLKMKGATLHAVLHSLLEQAGLTYVICNDVLEVTTPEDAGNRMRTVVYDVRDLVIVKDGIDFDSLAELITTTVNPDSWDDGSGPGPLQDFSPGWLVFSQTDLMHADTAELLTRLREHLHARSTGKPPAHNPAPAERNIAAALDWEIKLDYQGRTLQQVVDDLAQRSGINMRLDVRKLAETSDPTDVPLNCHLPSLPLKLAIRRLLEVEQLAGTGLAWAIQDECLVLTTQDEVTAEREILILDVRGLAGPGEDKETFDEDYLDELLQAAFGAERRNLANNCSYYRSLLVVSAPREVNAEVRKLVEALARFRDESFLARQRGTAHVEPFPMEIGEADLSPVALRMQIYPVNDLLGSEGPLAIEELQTAIANSFSEETSGDVIPVPPDGLLVFQSPDGHQQVQRFLDELRQHIVPSYRVPQWLGARDKNRSDLAKALASREQDLSHLSRMNELHLALSLALGRDVILDPEHLPFGFQDLPPVRDEPPPGNHPPTIKEQLAAWGLAVVANEEGFMLTLTEKDQRLEFFDVRDLLSLPVPFEVDELFSIFDRGLTDAESSWRKLEPSHCFYGRLIVQAQDQHLKEVEQLLSWLRKQSSVPRVRGVHQRQDPAESRQLLQRLLGSENVQEQLYLSFVLQFAAPCEDGFEELGARIRLLSRGPNSPLLVRLRDVVHRWVVTLPNERLEEMFDRSHSPILRKAAIQTLSHRIDANKSGQETVLEAVESRIVARPGLSEREIDELRIAVEQRFLPLIHRTKIDFAKRLLDANPASAPRTDSPARTLVTPPWRQPRIQRRWVYAIPVVG